MLDALWRSTPKVWSVDVQLHFEITEWSLKIILMWSDLRKQGAMRDSNPEPAE